MTRLRDYDILTRLIRTRPLTAAAIAYLLGCITGYAVKLPVWIWAVCTGLFLLPAIFIRKERRRWIPLLLILTMLPFGGFRFTHAWNAVPVVESKDPVHLSGRIVSMPEYRSDTERCICVLDEITIDGHPQDYKLRLYLRGDTALLQNVSIAEAVSCEAHLWKADPSSNPGQFSFQDYLRRIGLSGYATAEIEKASFEQQAYRLSDRLKIFKDRLGTRIEALFPQNPALARAFLIGDRSHLSEYDRENFSKSGVAHLLAISGMHISTLAAMISMLLSRFTSRKTAFAVTMAVLIPYGALIGFTPSYLRALTVFLLFSAAPIVGRNYDSYTALSAAMLIYLLIRPVSILESGFTLSFGASAGIIFLYSPLRALFGAEAFLARRHRFTLLSLFTRRLPKYLISSVLISLAAQIAIYPAVIHSFGYQSPWTLLANIVCVPIAMLAYIASIVGALSGTAFVSSIGDTLFTLLKTITGAFSALPLSHAGAARFPFWLCALFALSLILASDLSRISMKIRRFIPLALVPMVLLSSLIARQTLSGCSVVFFDAGQADCAALRCEGKFYLVDTGDDYTPAVDYMRMYNYRPEAVFLSHCHDDHAGGLAGILDYAPPKTLYLSANWNSYECGEEVAAAVDRAAALGCEIAYLSAGDEIQLSDQTFLQVLGPKAGFPAKSANDDSLIMHLRYGEASVLFTGDCSAGIVSELAVDADILKAAHHGGKDSVNAALIEKLTPSAAFIPVGYNNFGHPSEDTIRMLEYAGAAVYRGDECGAVTCELNANGSISVRYYKNPEAGNGME